MIEAEKSVAQCMKHGECFGGKCIYQQPKREWVGLTGEILLCAAQSSLSPDQYDHFEAISEHEPEVYDRLAKAIKSKLKEKTHE